MLMGYARISSDDQKLDLQRDALTKAGVKPEHIYEETASGVKSERPQLAECLKALREGDMLVIYRLDRLGRSLKELIEIAEKVNANGIGLRSLCERIDTTDTTTPSGSLVFHMFGAVAQFERDLVVERTRAGLKAARLRGHKGGRKPKMTAKQIKLAKVMLDDPTVTHQEVAEACGVSRATLYRTLNKDREQQEAAEIAKLEKRKKTKPHQAEQEAEAAKDMTDLRERLSEDLEK